MRTILAVLALSTAALAGEQAPWEDQLREMGHLLYRTSGANVVNGLNLTREQAVQLREFAVELGRAGASAPDPQGEFTKDLALVRETYRELYQVLSRGEEVSDDLRARVVSARAAESKAIAESLTWNPDAPKNSCARCHTEPGTSQSHRTVPASAKQEQAYAHIAGGFDQRGLVTLAALSKKVDGILTDAQKAVLSEFSCCLVPPKGMSDPVRVGQADVSDLAIEALEKARSASEKDWPTLKRRLLDGAERIEFLKRPDLSAADRAALRERVGAVYEKARTMSEMDFELGKADLARELKGPAPQQAPEDKRPFMAAFFLLTPGSVETYDRLLERMDRPATAPKTDGTPAVPAEGST